MVRNMDGPTKLPEIVPTSESATQQATPSTEHLNSNPQPSSDSNPTNQAHGDLKRPDVPAAGSKSDTASGVVPGIPVRVPIPESAPQRNHTPEGDHDDEREDSPLSDPESSSSDFPRKVPILRLKKKGGEDSMDFTFEKQDASKNDSYCWVCHDGGDVLCCDNCPRVFHVQCSGLNREPEGEEEWICPVCKNIAKKTKRSRPSNLKELLLLAVNRMMFPGTEIFQHDVPEDIIGHYREYIFFPMHLGKIKKKVLAGQYQSTRAFLHDTEWILHNCIIYNGAKHALTKISKGIVKVCKEDMREIELCPSCYSLTVKQPEDWFCIPCSTPHRVILAKVRGYPLWPAKLISETSDKCDVRFFGQHDRSLVPKSSIQELNGPPPTPTSKTQYWNIAMYELQRYRENIKAMFEQIGGTKMAGFNTGSIERPPKPKDPKSRPKLVPRSSPGQSNHYDFPPPSRDKQPYNHDEGMGHHHGLPISNYVPFSPQLVEVNINYSEGEEGSIHGNSATLMQQSDNLSNPSSPGSEPELQIDLGGVGGGRKNRDKYSPAKARIAPPANRSLLGGLKRTANPPSSLDVTPGGQRAGKSGTSSPQMTNNSSSGLTTPKGSSFKRKGEAISALANSLYERKRIAEMGRQVGVPTPLQASTPAEGAVGGGAGPETMETDPAQEDSEETTATTLNQQFSSIYLDRNKTTIAVVDPDQKRIRKRKNPAADTPPRPKKASRTQNASKVAASQQNAHLEPATEVATPSPSAQLQQDPAPRASLPVPGLRADTPMSFRTPEEVPMPAAIGTSGGGGGGAKGSGGGAQGGSAKGQPQSKTQAHGTPQSHQRQPGGKKARSRANKAAASKAAGSSAAVVNSSKTSAASPVKASTPSSSSAPPPPVATAVTTQDAAGVRGGDFAPGILEEETPEFAEGSGLLADTIRKVDRTFRVRLNQMAGGSEDMGYQYFTEKLMSSIKTVLIEMLSSFEAKGKLGAKQLKEQLHTAWPVPNSRGALEKLRRELVADMKQNLEVVQASAALERQQVVTEVRRQAEAEKEIAINETKKKKWCSYCLKEAQYNCCWNANYCNESCQQSHWPEHMKNCTQVQQQIPRTPASIEIAGTPVSKVPPPAVGGPGGIVTPQGAELQGLVYTSSNQNGAVNLPSLSSSSHPPPHPHQLQHHRGSVSEQGGMMVPMEALPQGMDQSAIEQSASHIEHIPNDSVMLNPASPPNHIRTLLLSQQMAGSSNKSPVITGSNPILIGQSPALGHHHHHLGAHLVEGTLTTSGNPTLASSDHSSTSGSLANMSSLHSQHPMSPVTPPSENPPSVHNPTFSWPYNPQPVIIGGENYPHGLPLLPAVQANTPTSSQAFFKAF